MSNAQKKGTLIHSIIHDSMVIEVGDGGLTSFQNRVTLRALFERGFFCGRGPFTTTTALEIAHDCFNAEARSSPVEALVVAAERRNIIARVALALLRFEKTLGSSKRSPFPLIELEPAPLTDWKKT